MRIGGISLGLSLLVVILMPYLTAPVCLLAQADKIELNLRLLPGSYNELTAGDNNTLFLEVKNNGNTKITNISLDSNKPVGWKVDFEPAIIGQLSAGSSQTVDVIIVPSDSSGRGEYTVTLIAEASETRAATSAFLRVENGSSFWLWLGGGVAILVVAVFVIVFRRFG
jgi:uncharacterized membrane protein